MVLSVLIADRLTVAAAETGEVGGGMVLVREARASDEGAWRALWEGYIRFYESSVAPVVTDRTWARILDVGSPLIGRVAKQDGRLVGITVSVLHDGTWTTQPILYLEDLFVDPEARGGGIGSALMNDIVTQARQRGCARLYWHTRADNAAARRLYDRFVAADDFVRYRVLLDESGS